MNQFAPGSLARSKMAPEYLDRFNERVVIGNKFILYRNRSIPFSEIKEIRVKNSRFMINHFNNNLNSPRMCILFPSKETAQWFHDEMINGIYFRQ